MKIAKKAQAAFENIYIYAVVILIILITVSVLSYYNILNSSKYIPESCDLNPRILCTDYKINESGYGFVQIQNKLKEDIYDLRINVGKCSEGYHASLTRENTTVIIFSNCGKFSANQKYDEPIRLKYKVLGSSLDFNVAGNLLAKIEKGIIPFFILPELPVLLKQFPLDYIEAWADFRTSPPEIYYFNSTISGYSVQCLSTPDSRRVTNTLSNSESGPVVYDDIIVWYGNPSVGCSGASDIYLCNTTKNGQDYGCLSTDYRGSVTCSSVNTGNYLPAIYDNLITWSLINHLPNPDTANIYYCNLSKDNQPGGCLGVSSDVQVTSNTAYNINPDFDKQVFVWEGDVSGNIDIYACNKTIPGVSPPNQLSNCNAATSKTRVTSEPAKQANPYISGNIIVWEHVVGPSNNDIYMCNLSKNGNPSPNPGGCFTNDPKVRITKEPRDQIEPAIYDHIIVWQDYTLSKIFMCNMSLGINPGGCHEDASKTELGSGASPDIYGNSITWISGSGLLMCDLTINGKPGGCLPGDAKIVIDTGVATVPRIYGEPGNNFVCTTTSTSTSTTSTTSTSTTSSTTSSTSTTTTILPQFARPDMDISNLGGWADTPTNSILYDDIDEAPPIIDADYIQRSPDFIDPDVLMLITVRLSDVTDPLSSSGHVLRYRIRRSAALGGTLILRVRLMQGTTEIMTRTETAIPTSFATAHRALTAIEIDKITDYSDLRIEFGVSGTATLRQVHVSWAELEVPSP